MVRRRPAVGSCFVCHSFGINPDGAAIIGPGWVLLSGASLTLTLELDFYAAFFLDSIQAAANMKQVFHGQHQL